jgi:hypothetical protein
MTRVFISYSHQDEQYRVELDKHMALLRREKLVDVWSDHCIRPGEEFDPAIAGALEAADLILLLISADFMHSDYCSTVEMTRAMERHKEGSARVVPIILRPCDWHSAPFGRIKSLPTDAKEVTRWRTLDEAFLNIVQQLRSMLTQPASRAAGPASSVRSAESLPPANTPIANGSARMPRSSNLALPRKFSDEDRYDFTVRTFAYVQTYYEGSLQELQARNPGTSSRLTPLSPVAFKAIIFQEGKRVAGCQIHVGGAFASDGIAYSANENAGDNSYNELLSVETDKHMLFLKASMAMFNRGDKDARLTEEGAAEHLWSMFIGNLQQ